jgi:cardiolipin synthase
VNAGVTALYDALGSGVYAALLLLTGGHALLNKRDPRAAWGWIAVCVLLPFFGPVLYIVFGVNRVQTRAQKLGVKPSRELAAAPAAVLPADQARQVDSLPPALRPLARTSEVLTGLPLLQGNRVEVLHDGEQAYPRMLAAIDGAQQSIALASYIFDSDELGREFIAALARAHRRGVAVHCLLDGLGELYSKPTAGRLLRAAGIDVARFTPPRLLPPSLHVNLRNHRKLLLVDGGVGFTGGMNISRRHLCAAPSARHAIADLHFQLRGPIIAQLQQTFAEDWRFAAARDWPAPEPDMKTAGYSACRAIVDGPNEDLDHLRLVLLAAFAAAQQQLFIMTPYFLPTPDIITALQSAALRGVDVAIILPERNNIAPMRWAARHMLGHLLERGVRIYDRPAPFAHSKLLLIDGRYTHIGSANLDPRSLRLNFELTVETYDDSLAGQLLQHFEAVRAAAREMTLEELQRRPLAIKLRDALCWLFSPYL